MFLLSKKALIVPLGYCEMGEKPAALGKDKSFITFLDVFKVPHKCCVGAESSAALAAGKQGCSTMAHSQLCCFRRHHLLLHITHVHTSLHLPPRIIYLHRVCSFFLCPGTSSLGRQGGISGSCIPSIAVWGVSVLRFLCGLIFMCSFFIGMTSSKVRSLFCFCRRIPTNKKKPA